MVLKDAQDEFESLFEKIVSRDRQQETKDLCVVWSGGVRTWDETSFALYATKEAAIKEWLSAAKSIVRTKEDVLEWVLKPELIEFQVTIADRLGRHRAVNNRFAVKSQFILKDPNG